MNSPRHCFRNTFAGITMFLTAAAGMTLVTEDAEAGRLGGGRSFGRQSPNLNRQPVAPAQKAPTQNTATTPAQTPPATGNRWLGPIAGIAAGLGIAAMLSHFGLSGAFASALGNMLVIALLAFAAMYVWRMFRASRQAPATASPFRQAFDSPMGGLPGSSAKTNVFGQPLPELQPSTSAVHEAPANWSIPADFDVEGFLRNAKVHFNRLQAAWDARDLADIRKFTTPEAFAEIKMQREESTGKDDRTEVQQLDATLLGIETTPEEYVASVRFTGTLRENNGSPAPFEEIWNLAKPVDGKGGWLLAGIQQTH